MARNPRSIVPGVAYHLISRFVNHEWFIDTDAKRSGYLSLLSDSLKSSDWRCLAYAIMSNHIHLAFVAGRQPIGTWSRRVHSPFAEWINSTQERIGAVFARGPKAIEIPPDQIARVLAYIHNNPVRAAVTSRACESRWTSHRAYVGLEPAPPWLHVGVGLSLAGFGDPQAFDRWVEDPDANHVDQVRELAHPDAPPAPMANPDLLIETIVSELGISASHMSSSRSADASRAREVAVHCAAELGITGTLIASAIGVTPQAVSLLRRRNAPGVRRLVRRVLQCVA